MDFPRRGPVTKEAEKKFEKNRFELVDDDLLAIRVDLFKEMSDF